ncbi:MAG: hypothetical protein ACYSU2_17975, partial [Planctomycetota bacterium]
MAENRHPDEVLHVRLGRIVRATAIAQRDQEHTVVVEGQGPGVVVELGLIGSHQHAADGADARSRISGVV